MTLEQSLALAARWLSESPVYEREAECDCLGAVRAGYDRQSRCFLYRFHEITGYALNTFVALHRQLGDRRYLDDARRSAAYLLSCQCRESGRPEHGAFLHSVTLAGERVPRYYSFDTAIIAHGLLALGDETGDQEFIDAAAGAAQWLVGAAQLAEGAFRSYFETARGWRNEPPTEFSGERGCLHAKHAVPLLKAYRLTGEHRFREAAEAVCRWVLTLQREDGAFWANPARRYVHPHAHCYATEGLLYAGHAGECEEFTAAATRAADWLASVQCRDGAILCAYDDRRSAKAWLRRLAPVAGVDVVSQAVRIWTLLRPGRPELDACIRRGVTYLQSQQIISPRDLDLHGVFRYQQPRGMGWWQQQNVVYTWPTQFAVQALRWQLAGAEIEELY